MSKNTKYALILIVNFIVMFAMYLLFVRLSAVLTFTVYSAVFAGFAFTYVIYNRGFSRRNVTLDMLPDEWPPEKKTEFIEDAKRRLERSKWMLTVIVPLIGIYAYELIDVFVVPTVVNFLRS